MAFTQVSFRGKPQRADTSFRVVAFIAAALVLSVLVLIAITMTSKSLDAFRVMGLRFFTTKRWAPPQEIFGALSFIYGTLVVSLIAVILAVPVSIGIALFTTQVAPAWLKRPIVTVMDLLAVIPSVVFGLWGVIVLAPWIKPYYDDVHNWFGDVPIFGSVFGPAASGRSFFTAGIILAIMITPIITAISREVIDTCPSTDREGAFALGATRWEMIRGVVLPYSREGLVGAVMLGLGRAMGETIAVALVIGSAPQITANVFSSGDALPAVIANQWGESTGNFRSALVAFAVTVFLITLLVNLLANTIVARAKRRAGA